MLHIYGIIDSREIQCAIPFGHDLVKVRAFPLGEFAAVVSDTERPEIEATVENVWRHDQVLDALMTRHAVLPVRFGTISNGERLASVLEQRRSTLLQVLQRVHGKVEIAMRVLENLPEKAVAPPAAYDADHGCISGAAYLRTRKASHERAAVVCERTRAGAMAILDQLGRLSDEVVWAPTNLRTLPVEASFLVKKDGVRDFVGTADALASRYQDVAVSCTGPWAPYSFVDVSMNRR